MAGHSKWANIQHRKGRQDAKRGKIFTRLIKEITVAARMGGADVGTNPRLRMAVDKAKGESMPKDNIENAIKRGAGTLEGVNYEEIRYEGYGISGAAVIVDCLTDNRNRTASEVRSTLVKSGGALGETGSVGFMFDRVGVIQFDGKVASEEEMFEAALEAGAQEVESSQDVHVVITQPDSFTAVRDVLITKFSSPGW